MISAEDLLNPISAESPCGEDISYDPRFLALDALIAGKPETQFSVAEEPDWRALREACLELFERSKNLRVAVTLCLALLNLEGASGLREGLALLKGMLERYWPDLYPKLDPEDNNDPLERINILASLSTPLGTFGDPMKFLQRLRQIPLANSAQMGRLNLAEIAGDKILLPEGGEKPPISAAQVKAVFRDTSTEELAATAQAISDSIAFAKDIDNFLTTTVGADRAPDMDAFVASLSEIEKCLAPYLPKSFSAGVHRRPDRNLGRLDKRGRSSERSHTIKRGRRSRARPHLRILRAHRALESPAFPVAAGAAACGNGFPSNH